MSTRNWSLEKITSKHVRQAAKDWEQNQGFENFKQSLRYDVVINGRPYPPKAIASMAHKYATGQALTTDEFGGAKDGKWHTLFRKLGFEVVGKNGFEEAIATSKKLLPAERLKKIEATTAPPKKYETTVKRFFRNPHVVAERLYRAAGCCADCQNPGPFPTTPDNTPFLEVHHDKPLSMGGLDNLDNTVALCPNCHSKRHYLLRISRDEE